jgi:hypothetical protein
VVADVQDDLAPEVQPALYEPLQVLVGTELAGPAVAIAPKPAHDVLEPSKSRFDGPGPQRYRGSP